MYVDSDMIREARTSDLYHFLTSCHPDCFRREGQSLRMAGHEGISIRKGYYGFKDFSTGETGNGIDFLIKYMGYSFQEAVAALSGGDACKVVKAAGCGHTDLVADDAIDLPPPAPFPHSRMFAYLIKKRGLCPGIVSDLAADGLIYQSAPENNIVFVNRERDYCEIRGTYTFSEKPFHGCRKNRPDRFWYLMGSKARPEKAYVTEAAIDAVSLYLLHKNGGVDIRKNVYISIGGASNHLAIKRIKHGIRTILAVDNDNAGLMCRNRHSELDCIIPRLKDWNDDLRYFTCS